ncbi:hypothetical protein SprV_0702271900 [Sparganum proliferum]
MILTILLFISYGFACNSNQKNAPARFQSESTVCPSSEHSANFSRYELKRTIATSFPFLDPSNRVFHATSFKVILHAQPQIQQCNLLKNRTTNTLKIFYCLFCFPSVSIQLEIKETLQAALENSTILDVRLFLRRRFVSATGILVKVDEPQKQNTMMLKALSFVNLKNMLLKAIPINGTNSYKRRMKWEISHGNLFATRDFTENLFQQCIFQFDENAEDLLKQFQ